MLRRGFPYARHLHRQLVLRTEARGRLEVAPKPDVKVRVLRRWGPARIAGLLGLNPATVHRVLSRYGMAHLAHCDRAIGRVVRRYERAAPGELVHVDIKKLGNTGARSPPATTKYARTYFGNILHAAIITLAR